jgi:hypothetical protein
MAHRTALKEVFALPELFSAILLHLPIHDLLLSAPLVSHTWNDLIARSPSLQACLFFHPRPHHPLSALEINPLLQAAFRPWFHNRPLEYSYPALMFTSLDWNRSYAKQAAFSRKEASWRRMLPVQPPAKILEVVKLSYHEDQQYGNKGEVRFEHGVRMGTLYDLGYQTLRQPISSFWISWQMFPDMDCQDFGWGCWDEDEELEHAVSSEADTITFTLSKTIQEDIPETYILGPEFRSLGYQTVDVEFSDGIILSWEPDFHPGFNEMWNHDHNYGL